VARDEHERALLWKGRKNAFGAVGRLSPTYYVQDGVIPRTKLPDTLRRINEIGTKHGFEIGNIFHAGDGNLHPIILFDAREEEQFRRAVVTADEIIGFCIEMGGSITGEHGVGMEKDRLMPLLFSEDELNLMRRVRDAFNPAGLLNPGKNLSDHKRLRRNSRAAVAGRGCLARMSTAGATVGSRLADIVGPQHVITDPARLAAFAVDNEKPSAAVSPQSSAEIVEVVKFAAKDQLGIVATGARTKLGIGLPPRRYDIALDMTRLDRVVAYDPGDLTLSVEAGIPLRKLGGILAEHRQFLPLGVPYLSQTTIGGTIASGVDSPLRQMYGTARDYLLGMEFVTGEGVAAKSGGRVVKNVTGYDIHKLMIGALGTLGIITRINFKTFPMPSASRAFRCHLSNSRARLRMRNRVAQSPLAPMTMELFSPGVAGLFSSKVAAQIEPNSMPENVIPERAGRLLWASREMKIRSSATKLISAK